MTTTKTCTKCKEDKELGEFNKHRTGLRSNCRECQSAAAKAHRIANHAEYLRKEQDRRDRLGENLTEYNRLYRDQNRDAIRSSMRRWQEANRDKCSAASIKSQKKRLAVDPLFRAVKNLRTRMWSVLNGTSKHAPTLKLLGCTVEHFRFHLEQQFSDGMTWDNYGDWHLDHVQPCASFDQTDPEQQKQCWHYTNYQPLWAEDNLRKSDTIPSEHQTKLL